jgi:hypothetical protein
VNKRKRNPLYAAWKRHGLVRQEFGGWWPPHDVAVGKTVVQLGKALEDRKTLCQRFAWAIPTAKAIQWIVARAPRIVEMGAGRGYWARLLADAGADVVAYDQAGRGNRIGPNPWHYQPDLPEGTARNAGLYGLKNNVFHPVQFGRAKAVAAHPDRALFLCWPPYDTPFAKDCLRHYRGNDLFFVGEGSGGCTGDDAFFARLDREWTEAGDFTLPQWPGMRDYLTHYRRTVPLPAPSLQAARAFNFEE